MLGANIFRHKLKEKPSKYDFALMFSYESFDCAFQFIAHDGNKMKIKRQQGAN